MPENERVAHVNALTREAEKIARSMGGSFKLSDHWNSRITESSKLEAPKQGN